MSFPKRPLLLLCLFALLARASAGTPGAERLDLEHTTPAVITVTPVAERWDGDGFMPMRVRIENRGREPMAWDFSFDAALGYGGVTISHDLTLGAEPGSAFETVVFVPGAGSDSPDQRAFINIALSGPGAWGHGASMLHGRNEEVVHTATTASLETWLFTISNGAPGTPVSIGTIDPSLWPADWRVWSPFDRVVLDDREYAALDGARRAALRDWVAMGGTLDLYPTDGFEGPAEPARPHGHGMIRRMERSLAREATRIVKASADLEETRADMLADSIRASVSSERREEMRLTGGALGVSFFLIAFGVAVGPVNLFIFAPSRRRHRLFITTPLISLAASLALAGYIVAKDGFGGEGARNALVFLLPESNQAVVTQGQIARTGVLLGGGFELPDDVVIARVERGSDRYFDHRRRPDSYSRSAGWTEGDWFASRRVQEHSLRRLVPTRARVELVGGGKDGAPPVVQSSVGTTLREFVYRDARGARWVADAIAPGERVTLRLSSGASDPLGLSGMFTARGGAAEGLGPIETLDSVRWDETEFTYAGPVVVARTP